MQTAQIVRRTSCWGVWSLLVVSSLAGCAGSSDAERQDPAAFRAPKSDYQQPLRAAGGEILGANQQDPSDTLRALPTNLHPAAGWEIEKGKLQRARPGSAEDMRDKALACARALAAPGEPAVIHKPMEPSAEISRETALLATACDVPLQGSGIR